MMDENPETPRSFRSQLYLTYKSAEENSGTELGPAKVQWFDRKLFPFIADLDPRAPILELGSGDGLFLEYLESKGFEDARGIDISEAQVATARLAGRQVELAHAARFLEETNDSFQCVVCIDVLEHMTRTELLELMPLINRRLAAGGRLLVQTVNAAGLFPFQVAYGDLTHMTFMNEGSLRQLFRWAGFEELEFIETGPIPIGTRGVIRWILWRLIRAIAQSIRLAETGKTQRVWTENMIAVAYKRWP